MLGGSESSGKTLLSCVEDRDIDHRGVDLIIDIGEDSSLIIYAPFGGSNDCDRRRLVC